MKRTKEGYLDAVSITPPCLCMSIRDCINVGLRGNDHGIVP